MLKKKPRGQVFFEREPASVLHIMQYRQHPLLLLAVLLVDVFDGKLGELL